MKMGSIHRILEEFEQTHRIYQRLIDEYPDSHFVSDDRFEILVTYYDQGEYGAVIEQAPHFIDQKPSRAHILRTYVLLGDTYKAIGSPKDAVTYYIVALKKSKDLEVRFLGIDKCRFRKPVIPGDQIRFEMESVSRKRTIYKFRGKAFVDGQVAAEAELLVSC